MLVLETVIGVLALLFIALFLRDDVISKREEMDRIRLEVEKHILYKRDYSSDSLIRGVTHDFLGIYNKRVEIELPRLILVRLFLRKEYRELSRMYRELKEI